MTKKPRNYWSTETIVNELLSIISIINKFPITSYLRKNNMSLMNAISKHGGVFKFQRLVGCIPEYKQKGYWTDETILNELNDIINNTNNFPTHEYLESIGKKDIVHAICNHGGINRFRKIMKYDVLKATNGYWTEDSIIFDLKDIIKNNNNVFPTVEYLKDIDRIDIVSAITNYGGMIWAREKCGFSVTEYNRYMSDIKSYINKRGKNTEDIVFNILSKYCSIKDINAPIKNRMFPNKKRIEFVCENNKNIGIDVTNTRTINNIRRKWTKCNYHKYLDELWIVVVSDSISSNEYKELNINSPDNVYIYSIEEFCNELQYDLDDVMENKIKRYKSCTFHTRNQYRKD